VFGVIPAKAGISLINRVLVILNEVKNPEQFLKLKVES
jgi:hypothetical protein